MVVQHHIRKDKNGFSRWHLTVGGRKRAVEVQDYKGRLYLVGCLFSGHTEIASFEEPVYSVVRRLGQLVPA